MTDNSMFLVRYYNSATPVYYDYSDTDTVESFFATHPEIGDQEISQIYAGNFIYQITPEYTIHSVVENMDTGEAAIAFPEFIVINITHININNEQETAPFLVSYLQKQYMMVDSARAHFGISTNTKCEFYSDVEAYLPEDVCHFDFQATDFYLKEVSN
ncbi:hypothetical protein IW148_005441 [Coemansia sp. RSA 1199]|nr:hypothetical protein IW148_005441 [Coemansia sp. RSA 1199]